jgi:peptidoglycan/xylan/chitin deacetylase (PgdA/CDA1 family)
MAGVAAVAAPVVSLLSLHTAYAEQAVDCPIYLFHATSAAAVENVLFTNRRQGRLPVTVADLTAIMLGEQDVPAAPLFCMSFDDGYLVQYQQAVPVLDRYQAPATFFVMGTGWQGDGVHTYMNADQIQNLAQRGFEIGSHTVNHANLVALRARNRGAYLGEIFSSKSQLEDLIQSDVTSFCYPNGAYDAGVIADVSTAYRAAATEITGRAQSSSARYLLRRTHMS